MNNYSEYADGHWSTVPEPTIALEKYLKQYESIYNSMNLERLLSVVPKKPAEILDYGGGCGMLAVTLAKMGHNVTLIDASKLAIATAIYHAKQEGITLEAKSATSLREATLNRQFDIVFAKDLIEHVVDDTELVQEFAGALNDGGRLVMTTQNALSLNYIIEAGIRKILRPSERWMGWDRTHLRFYTPRKLRILIERSGLHLECFNSAYIFPYKLVSRVFPFIDPHKKSVFSEFDRVISRVPIFAKCGWNIMVVAKKPTNKHVQKTN